MTAAGPAKIGAADERRQTCESRPSAGQFIGWIVDDGLHPESLRFAADSSVPAASTLRKLARRTRHLRIPTSL
jgi:hypothetical protein